MRTPFQRDRDRIVHSKAFRRLKHKTQVFIAPEGDHYRTRLTHTLETCFIARTVARALGLNEDLTEAIGLGHDLGHPPFGHIGEEALDEALRDRGADGFQHNRHSLRVVDVLERDGHGLNLTEPVRDGILNHTGLDASRRRSRGGSCGWSTGSPTSTTTSTTRVRAGILAEDDLPAARDRAARPDRRGADRHAGARHRRDARASAATSPSPTRSAARCCGCASSCSTTSISGAEARSEHDRVQRTLRGAVRPLPRVRSAERRARRGAAAGDRLRRRDDRPLRDRHASGGSRCPRSRGCERSRQRESNRAR